MSTDKQMVYRLGTISLLNSAPICARVTWCERGDSNPYAFRRQNLNLVRIPISPHSQTVLHSVLLRQRDHRPYHFWGTFELYQNRSPRPIINVFSHDLEILFKMYGRIRTCKFANHRHVFLHSWSRTTNIHYIMNESFCVKFQFRFFNTWLSIEY